MNLIKLHDQIINLDNVTTIKKYRPHEIRTRRLHCVRSSDAFEIGISFNLASGCHVDFGADFESLLYDKEDTWAQDWHRLCDLAMQ